MTGTALSIPLAGLLAELPGATRHLEVEGLRITLDDGLELASPISGSVQIARTNRGVLVDATIRTSLGEECSRCLRPVETPLTITIREEALPSIEMATGQSIDASAEPDVARLSNHHELDLEALFREAISLAEPIAPLCEPDCPGLCAICAERLDANHVDHGEDEIDPRLAALQAFQVDAEPENE